jgi:hypothetical protein
VSGSHLPTHPGLAPIAFLLGTWRGEGEGVYPGVDPFRYTEELSFEPVGDPLLVTESSWTPDGAPLHFERGTLRRRYHMEGDGLSYELDMATEGVARTFHVRSTLARA